MHRATILCLKALLVVMFGLLLVAQVVLIPQVARSTALLFPEFAQLEVPGIVIAVAFLACVQVVLVCLWRLLSMVRVSTIFSARAFVWVDVILGAIIAATLLLAAAMVILTISGASNPGIALLFCFGIVVGAGLALVIVVMRGLLRNARTLQEEMAEVV